MCEAVSDFYLRERLLITKEQEVVKDLLKSYVRLNPDVAILDTGNIIIRKDHLEMNKVKLLSGGPAGHEPAGAGYVGKGFLTASVIGEIYCAPSIEDILTAIKTLSRQHIHGILIIIADTLDNRLNFGYAVEKALNIPNINIKMLFVTDGVNGYGSKRSSVGIVLVQKIAGAMSELGFSLDEIYDYCESILDDIQTITMTLSGSRIVKGKRPRDSDEDMLEFGTGIYGEPPYIKTAFVSTKQTVEIMLEQINISNEHSKVFLDQENHILILINNLGCTTKLEQFIFIKEVITQFEEMTKFKVAAIYFGKFMTALRTIGLSITVMKLNKPEILDYVSYPCNVKLWRKFTPRDPEAELFLSTNYNKRVENKNQTRGPQLSKQDAELFKMVVLFACESLISCERQLNIMDAELGDADTGTNLRYACTLIIVKTRNSENFYYPYELFQELTEILWKNNVGLSGSLFCLIFDKTSNVFLEMSTDDIIDSSVWLETLKRACSVIKKIAHSESSAKNLCDPICSCIEEFDNGLKNKMSAIDAFELGVKAATNNVDVMNRFDGVLCDPGAYAVCILFRAVLDVLKINEKIIEKMNTDCKEKCSSLELGF